MKLKYYRYSIFALVLIASCGTDPSGSDIDIEDIDTAGLKETSVLDAVEKEIEKSKLTDDGKTPDAKTDSIISEKINAVNDNLKNSPFRDMTCDEIKEWYQGVINQYLKDRNEDLLNEKLGQTANDKIFETCMENADFQKEIDRLDELSME